MIEYSARLLRFADELEEGAHPSAALLRYVAETFLTLAGSMDRDTGKAGHEGPSRAEADELRRNRDKMIQFACTLGFDTFGEVGVLVIMLACGIQWKWSLRTSVWSAFPNLPISFRS